MTDLSEYNIENYTISQLRTLFNLDVNSTKEEITQQINNYRNEILNDDTASTSDKIQQINFLNNAQSLLISLVDDEQDTTQDEAKTSTEDVNDDDETNTDENTETRTIKTLINIDSQYRNQEVDADTQYTFDCNTNDMIFKLSETINNVVSIELTSIELPMSWYNFTSTNGTNYFDISSNNTSSQNVTVEVSNGYYNSTEIINSLQTSINNTTTLNEGGTSGAGGGPKRFDISLNNITKKVTLTSDNSFVFTCFKDENASINNYKKNNNLSYYLGFRKQVYRDNTTYTGESIINTFINKYINIVVDDFQKTNTKGVVNANNYDDSEKLDVPEYFTIDASGALNNNGNINIGPRQRNTSDNDRLPCSEVDSKYRRILTNSQIYTINQIRNNNLLRSTISHNLKSENQSNILARIPIDTNGQDHFTNIVLKDVPDSTRHYSGPVNISKLKISFTNNQGNLIDLNGSDWSLSITVTQEIKNTLVSS